MQGIWPDTSATVELFGEPEAIDEVAYQVVFDGTAMDANFDRALPMIQMSREFASEKAGMFVGAQLDGFTYLDAIPNVSRTRHFGDVAVRVLGIDVVNVVNITISKGHPPTPAM
jgi:hypothetical protein